MPIYEFRCQRCDTRFEAWLCSSQDTVACPNCGATLLEKQVLAPGLVSTGRTREAGYTYCDREERCERPLCSDGGSCRRG